MRSAAETSLHRTELLCRTQQNFKGSVLDDPALRGGIIFAEQDDSSFLSYKKYFLPEATINDHQAM